MKTGRLAQALTSADGGDMKANQRDYSIIVLALVLLFCGVHTFREKSFRLLTCHLNGGDPERRTDGCFIDMAVVNASLAFFVFWNRCIEFRISSPHKQLHCSAKKQFQCETE